MLAPVSYCRQIPRQLGHDTAEAEDDPDGTGPSFPHTFTTASVIGDRVRVEVVAVAMCIITTPTRLSCLGLSLSLPLSTIQP